jgi:hypothetical protein
VIAAVSVVLPWSMCPIVPMFTCGLFLSNFAFAISESPFLSFSFHTDTAKAVQLPVFQRPVILSASNALTDIL